MVSERNRGESLPLVSLSKAAQEDGWSNFKEKLYAEFRSSSR